MINNIKSNKANVLTYYLSYIKIDRTIKVTFMIDKVVESFKRFNHFLFMS